MDLRIPPPRDYNLSPNLVQRRSAPPVLPHQEASPATGPTERSDVQFPSVTPLPAAVPEPRESVSQTGGKAETVPGNAISEDPNVSSRDGGQTLFVEEPSGPSSKDQARGFHIDLTGADRFDAGKKVEAVIKSFKEIDNKPGDSNPSKRKVTFNSGEGEVNAQILDSDYVLIQRFDDGKGNVSISRYERPSCLGLIYAEGLEVTQSANGKVTGHQLVTDEHYDKSHGTVHSPHYYEKMPSGAANIAFTSIDAALSGDEQSGAKKGFFQRLGF